MGEWLHELFTWPMRDLPWYDWPVLLLIVCLFVGASIWLMSGIDRLVWKWVRRGR